MAAGTLHTFSAVILAGGRSTRMGGVSKQQQILCGKPVLVHTLLAFERVRSCAEIVLVTRADEMQLCKDLAKEYGITKLKRIVEGGETRQDSAFHGMKSVNGEIPYIAFHDAARCLVTPGLIEKVFRSAVRDKCASAVTPAVDTVKFIGRYGKTVTTGQPDRSRLVYMQTPQIFCADLYRAAAYLARKEGFAATDDATLLEHAGFGVKTVPSPENNMKITTPTDLIVAEAILRDRMKQKGSSEK